MYYYAKQIKPYYKMFSLKKNDFTPGYCFLYVSHNLPAYNKSGQQISVLIGPLMKATGHCWHTKYEAETDTFSLASH